MLLSPLFDDLLAKLDDLPAGRRAAIVADLQQIQDRLQSLHPAHPGAGQAMLLDNLHDAVVAMDAQMNITLWNHSAELISGVSAKDAIGKKFYEVVRRQNATLEQREGDRQQIGERGSLRTEYTFETPDGRLLTMERINVALRDEAGELTGYLITSRDVTERKQAETFNRALNSINQSVHSTLDFELIVQAALEEATIALEADSAALSLYDGQRWRVRSAWGFDQDVIGTEMNDDQERHALLAIQTRQTVAVSDTANDARVNREHLLLWGIRSVLAVPLLLKYETVGVIFFNYLRHPMLFQDTHIDFATHLAASLALALENALLVQNLEEEIAVRRSTEEELRRKNAVLVGINHVFQKAISVKTEEELGRICLEVAEEVTQSKFGFIAELNSTTGKLDELAISDPGWESCRMQIDSAQGKHPPIAFEIRGLYGLVLTGDRGFYTNDPANHPNRVGLPEGHPPLTAFMGVPLVYGGQTIGMVGLANRTGGYSFDELEAIEALAPAIAQALVVHRTAGAVLQSEERFHTCVESLVEGLALLSAVRETRTDGGRPGKIIDLRFEYVNEAGARMRGKTVEGMIGRNILDVFPQYRASGLFERYVEVIETGTPLLMRSLEFEEPAPAAVVAAVSKPPRLVWAQDIHAVKLGDGLVVTRDDVTEYYQAEHEILENERRFRVALSALPMTVFQLDRSLQRTWAYHAPPQDSAPAQDLLAVLERAPGVMAAWQSVINTGHGTQREDKIFIDGEWKDCFTSLEPIRDDSGAVVGLTGAALDVTRQRQIEREHSEALNQMEIQRRLMEQREKDRAGIARDIHDGPVQTLSSISFNIQFVKEAFPDPALHLELEQISHNIKTATQELRQVINELRPPSLIRFGLGKAIQVHAEETRERYPDIRWYYRLADDTENLPEHVSLTLFRIYQEAVNNVVRHSQASRAWVSLSMKDDLAILEVRDNGKGLAEGFDLSEQTKRNHFGLAGMKERAEAIGGELAIQVASGEGARVTVKVPMGRRKS